MDTETGLRLVALLLLVLLLVPGILHRVRAAKSDEKISRREEGIPVLILLRLSGGCAWFGWIAFAACPDWIAWSFVNIPAWLRWTGVLLSAVAVVLVHWMFRSLGTNVTDTVAIRKDHRLITDGPYGWIRHPMYSFAAILTLGLSLLTASWLVALSGLLAVTLLVVRTPVEEAKLIDAFGRQYLDYMKSTGRFLPRWSGSKQ